MICRWLGLGLYMAMTTAAYSGPSPPPPPPPPPPNSSPPDESLIEFLGADDVGDTGWWEFLKNADPRAEQPPPTPPPPPQGAKR